MELFLTMVSVFSYLSVVLLFAYSVLICLNLWDHYFPLCEAVQNQSLGLPLVEETEKEHKEKQPAVISSDTIVYGFEETSV